MTHEQLQHDRADIIYELAEARSTWMRAIPYSERASIGKVALSADFTPIDDLLDELHDTDMALSHGEMRAGQPVTSLALPIHTESHLHLGEN